VNKDCVKGNKDNLRRAKTVFIRTKAEFIGKRHRRRDTGKEILEGKQL